jgi:segregation and condensation protein A
METHEKVFDILFNQDEITWQSILYDLVRTEQMDPWDVDISLLTKRYLEMVKKLKETDFRVSGKVLLAAAILLKMKSNRLVGDANQLDQMFNEPEAVELYDELEEEFQKMTTTPTPVLIPKTPQPRKRKVSIYDLVKALNKALEVKQRRVLNSVPPMNVEVNKKKKDITEVIKDIYGAIKSFFSRGSNNLTFSKLTPSKSKEDRVNTFVPLLHLANQDHRKIDLFQQQHFGDIEIMLASKNEIEKELNN